MVPIIFERWLLVHLEFFTIELQMGCFSSYIGLLLFVKEAKPLPLDAKIWSTMRLIIFLCWKERVSFKRPGKSYWGHCFDKIRKIISSLVLLFQKNIGEDFLPSLCFNVSMIIARLAYNIKLPEIYWSPQFKEFGTEISYWKIKCSTMDVEYSIYYSNINDANDNIRASHLVRNCSKTIIYEFYDFFITVLMLNTFRGTFFSFGLKSVVDKSLPWRVWLNGMLDRIGLNHRIFDFLSLERDRYIIYYIYW